jgi:uncharacterized membrane protein
MMAGYGAYGPALLAGTVSAVALVAAVALGVTGRRPRRPVLPGAEHPAVAVLKDRLARGEIDVEEFEQRLFTLLVHEPPR